MDQKNFALLQGVMLESMAKEINKKRPETDQIDSSAEQVFQNLPLIYETAVDKSFGEDNGSYNFMPLQYKAMVMRMVAPEYCPSVRATMLDDGVAAEAFLYLSPEDSKPVASGKMYVSFSSVRERFAETEDADIRFFTEELAKGSALSKAFEKFGIGSWFKHKFTTDDNPEKILSDLENQDKVMPEKAYGDAPENQDAPDKQEMIKEDPAPVQKKQKEPVSTADKKKAASKIADAEKTQEVNDKQQNVSANEDIQMSLDEARAIPAPIGKAAAKGLTLGETETQFPGNILWMYTRDIPVKEKTALKLIALANPEISSLFANAGIAI